jgi:hypothetical protein
VKAGDFRIQMTQRNANLGSVIIPSTSTPTVFPSNDISTATWVNYINGPGGYDARERLVNAVELQRRQDESNDLQYNVNLLNRLNVPRVFPGVNNGNSNGPVNPQNFFWTCKWPE